MIYLQRKTHFLLSSNNKTEQRPLCNSNESGHCNPSYVAELSRYARSSFSHPGTRLPTVRSSPFRYPATS